MRISDWSSDVCSSDLLYAAGLPIYLAIAGGIVLMFLFGLLAERLLLRKMVGQPIIMIVMLTLGLEIFLRGVGPGFLGASPKQKIGRASGRERVCQYV